MCLFVGWWNFHLQSLDNWTPSGVPGTFSNLIWQLFDFWALPFLIFHSLFLSARFDKTVLWDFPIAPGSSTTFCKLLPGFYCNILGAVQSGRYWLDFCFIVWRNTFCFLLSLFIGVMSSWSLGRGRKAIKQASCLWKSWSDRSWRQFSAFYYYDIRIQNDHYQYKWFLAVYSPFYSTDGRCKKAETHRLQKFLRHLWAPQLNSALLVVARTFSAYRSRHEVTMHCPELDFGSLWIQYL